MSFLLANRLGMFDVDVLNCHHDLSSVEELFIIGAEIDGTVGVGFKERIEMFASRSVFAY